MGIRFIICFVCFFAGCLMSLSALANNYVLGNLEIIRPWTRVTPVGADVAAGYFEIRNNGDAVDRLMSVDVENVQVSMIHEMQSKDGVMTMRGMSSGLEIPPGGHLTLKPGSLHVMMMGLLKPFKLGEHLHATLHFERSGEIVIDFTVEAIGENPTLVPDRVPATTN